MSGAKLRSAMTPDEIARRREYDRAAYLKNRERRIAQSRARYWANPDRYKDYIREYGKIRMAEKLAVMREAKAVPCMDCSGTFPACCMDFDHREEKRDQVSDMARNRYVTMQRMLEEMAKCDVVCSNCHRIRTEDRRKRNVRGKD